MNIITPQQCVELHAEEMMYIDGGFAWQSLVTGIKAGDVLNLGLQLFGAALQSDVSKTLQTNISSNVTALYDEVKDEVLGEVFGFAKNLTGTNLFTAIDRLF